jgi:hypothetical protein
MGTNSSVANKLLENRLLKLVNDSEWQWTKNRNSANVARTLQTF